MPSPITTQKATGRAKLLPVSSTKARLATVQRGGSPTLSSTAKTSLKRVVAKPIPIKTKVLSNSPLKHPAKAATTTKHVVNHLPKHPHPSPRTVITTSPLKASKMRFVKLERDVIGSPALEEQYQQIRTQKPPVCYYARQGPRDYMEDTFQIMHFNIHNIPGTFYGVFDGHGGKDVSYELVHMTRGLFPFLISNMDEYFKKNGVKNISQIIKASYLEYDRRLFQRNFNAGSTAIVILNFAKKLYLINLGDSRGMIFWESQLKNPVVSDDHKPQKSIEKTRIYKAGHFVNPFCIYTPANSKPNRRFSMGDIYADPIKKKYSIYLNGKMEPITQDQYQQIKQMTADAKQDTNRVSNSLALSRAFGDFYLKVKKDGTEKKYMGADAAVSIVPDIQIVDLTKIKDKIVYIFMASDGFWDVNRNTLSLRKSLITTPSAQIMCQNLVDGALDKGSQDNTTVLFDKIYL